MPSFSVKWSVKVLSVKLTKVREMVIKMQLVGTIWNQDE